MHFDEILLKVGGWGKYQKIQYLLLGVMAIFPGFQNLCMVFIGGGDHRHWCHVPELQNMSADQQRYIAIPETVNYEREIVYEQCSQFDINFGKYDADAYKKWNRTVMTPAGTKRVVCRHGYDFDREQYTSTIASQFDLVCGRDWMVALATTIYMAGFMTGCVAFGYMSDRYGRRLTLFVSIILQAIFGFAAAFVPNYAVFVIFRFLFATAVAGAFTTAFVIVVEIVGPKSRITCSIFYQGFFAAGYMLLPLLAYFIRDYRWLQITMLAPIFPTISYWWLVPESPRWLISERRYDKALEILNKMAQSNGEPELEKTFFDKEIVEKDEKTTEEGSTGHEVKDKHGSIIDLLSFPLLRKKSLIVFFNWFVNSLVYYGVSFSRNLMGGNLYISTFAIASVELPSYFMTVVLLGKWGRRRPLSFTMIVAGVACFLCSPFLYDPALAPALVTMAILGKFGIASSFAIIFLYSSELFPTVVRNVGVGTGSMHARIGGLVAPQVALLSKYWVPLPTVIFGTFAVAGGLLALYLPETWNKDLPETLEEGEEFVRNSELRKKEGDQISLTESSNLVPK
ncbi:organic cation transporter protein-like [Lineus longissimus]|uniref:organic cation transporter protein-like n=1 Tax=Lineus longissimus TaxID=88925 RepID=UPI00315DE494